MRKGLPVAILFVVGVLITADFFLKIPLLNSSARDIRTWVTIIANMALGLGGVNLLLIHGKRIQQRRSEWHNSVIFIGLLLMMIVIGIGRSTNHPIYKFVFDYVRVPISSTLFATAAFQIASASYRTFRVRNVEAALLLATGILVMLGKVPLGEMIHPQFPNFAQWILDVWNTAAQRGILISTAIGLIAISLRVILGLERGHFGAAE
jgi:hypothetical protein